MNEKYGVYQYNYDYTGSSSDYAYQKAESNSSHLVAICNDLAQAKQKMVALEREKLETMTVADRLEWANLSDDTIEKLKNFTASFGYELPFSENYQGKVYFDIICLEFDAFTDEQLLEFLALGGGCVYYIEENFSENFQQNVLYVQEYGYIFDKPYPYSQELKTCNDLKDFETIIGEYALYWNCLFEWNNVLLTPTDLANKKVKALLDRYEDNYTVADNLLDGSRLIIFKALFDDSNMKIVQELNNLIENPSFMIHPATNIDIMAIYQNNEELLEKYTLLGNQVLQE